MMYSRIIREPTSLLEAENEFKRQVLRAGWVIIDMQSHWQHNLFRDTNDAIVSGNIMKEHQEHV